jgi:hypothetical protein
MERFRKYLDVTHQYKAIAALLASMAVSDEELCGHASAFRFAPYEPFAASRRRAGGRRAQHASIYYQYLAFLDLKDSGHLAFPF